MGILFKFQDLFQLQRNGIQVIIYFAPAVRFINSLHTDVDGMDSN